MEAASTLRSTERQFHTLKHIYPNDSNHGPLRRLERGIGHMRDTFVTDPDMIGQPQGSIDIDKGAKQMDCGREYLETESGKHGQGEKDSWSEKRRYQTSSLAKNWTPIKRVHDVADEEADDDEDEDEDE